MTLDHLTRREFLNLFTSGTASAATLVLAGSTLSLLAPSQAEAAYRSIQSHLSPRNGKRPNRQSTSHIILHTTETEDSLGHVTRYGLANFVVRRDGSVHETISRDRIARHAGRSMWNGRANTDNYAIGIEVSGWHNRPITESQYGSIADLLGTLQSQYGVPDDHVLTHSMVAYGSPNHWHNRAHRGRKRCGMQFATPEVRRRLGLTAKPASDPDVRAHRLVNADPYLAQVLYGSGTVAGSPGVSDSAECGDTITTDCTAWSIARDQYASVNTTYVMSDGRRLAGTEITDWGALPNGTRVLLGAESDTEEFEGFREIGRDAPNAWRIAGSQYEQDTTIYFLMNGWVRSGAELSKHDLNHLAVGTKVLVGYVNGGHISKGRSAYAAVGKDWNLPSTFYRLPDGIVKSGDELDSTAIPPQTLVLFRQ